MNLLAWLRLHTVDSQDSRWERPGPTRDELRRDVIGVIVFALVSALALELSRGFGMVSEDNHPVWVQHLVLASMILPLVLRRRYPVIVMLVMSALFIALSLFSPLVSLQLSYQVAYFASLYSAVAWAKDRRVLWLGTTVVVIAMALWLILALTVANTFDAILAQTEDNADFTGGILDPLLSIALYNFLVNFAYFGGAILAGMSSWRRALQRTQLAEQAVQLSEQAEELARRAVVEERLRIARELHDVVAHHVSVIGVQAGAARRVIDKRPDVAVESLRTIEEASRQAVTDMRNLLGVLRSEGSEPGETNDGDRRPEPGLDDLEDLARQHRELGLTVSFGRVEDIPGALAEISAPLALSLFRTAQESLTNVRRHSTAGAAVMTLRTGRAGEQRWVELETVDNGMPRTTSDTGSGFGLRGIRERVALHRGTAEIGPRSEGGWRVRARFLLH
ncbi:signal transduction histidine kinase [Arthrobacter sp. CAN_A212]|uniref:sensor histidine kinase n=1 Tax=unclassified Arthrobacter TaxID=235627 RepID=UPI0018CA12B8|nr:histidine kinase [Arthrobacter sp. CAN_C5]MBP2217266.1 signal transduction histidine kinase [Arthrobacter sp. CAN_C5]